MWSTRHFFNLQSGVIAYTNNYGRNGHILQYKMFGKYCHWTFCTVFKDKLIFVRYMKQSLTLVFGTVFIGWNQLQIFDNDNFSIIPKSIFSDNDNLPISCKNANIWAVDNFFDNIAHPYSQFFHWWKHWGIVFQSLRRQKKMSKCGNCTQNNNGADNSIF